MNAHELKTWTEPFVHVVAGYKTHEARKNDRDFRVGDKLVLLEFIACGTCDGSGRLLHGGEHRKCCPAPHGAYTGKKVCVRVTYITPGGAFGLPEELCVMSIRLIASDP